MFLFWAIIKVYLVVWAPLMIVSVLVIMSHWLGKNGAKKKTDFHVAKQYPGLPDELAVILIYGEYLITAPLIRDPNGNQVEKNLYILKLSEMEKTPLTFEKVGPLKVKE